MLFGHTGTLKARPPHIMENIAKRHNYKWYRAQGYTRDDVRRLCAADPHHCTREPPEAVPKGPGNGFTNTVIAAPAKNKRKAIDNQSRCGLQAACCPQRVREPLR